MENAELTERFPISENGWLIQDFNVSPFGKIDGEQGFSCRDYVSVTVLIAVSEI